MLFERVETMETNAGLVEIFVNRYSGLVARVKCTPRNDQESLNSELGAAFIDHNFSKFKELLEKGADVNTQILRTLTSKPWPGKKECVTTITDRIIETVVSKDQVSSSYDHRFTDELIGKGQINAQALENIFKKIMWSHGVTIYDNTNLVDECLVTKAIEVVELITPALKNRQKMQLLTFVSAGHDSIGKDSTARDVAKIEDLRMLIAGFLLEGNKVEFTGGMSIEEFDLSLKKLIGVVDIYNSAIVEKMPATSPSSRDASGINSFTHAERRVGIGKLTARIWDSSKNPRI